MFVQQRKRRKQWVRTTWVPPPRLVFPFSLPSSPAFLAVGQHSAQTADKDVQYVIQRKEVSVSSTAWLLCFNCSDGGSLSRRRSHTTKTFQRENVFDEMQKSHVFLSRITQKCCMCFRMKLVRKKTFLHFVPLMFPFFIYEFQEHKELLDKCVCWTLVCFSINKFACSFQHSSCLYLTCEKLFIQLSAYPIFCNVTFIFSSNIHDEISFKWPPDALGCFILSPNSSAASKGNVFNTLIRATKSHGLELKTRQRWISAIDHLWLVTELHQDQNLNLLTYWTNFNSLQNFCYLKN